MIVESPFIPSSEPPPAPDVPTAGAPAAAQDPPLRHAPDRAAAAHWLEPDRQKRRASDDRALPPPRSGLELTEALLKAPARVLDALGDGHATSLRLALLAFVALAAAGVGIASFAGDLQLLVVPLKLTLGTLLCALICLPSLHVFSCLSGASQSLRQTASALLMGVALMAILLCGFAPVVWVFAQATSSVALVGALHLGFFLASAGLGLGLTRRALAALNDAPVAASGPWCVMFVLVLLQMATTLRPLVGPFDGALLHDRMFFLAHWASCLG